MSLTYSAKKASQNVYVIGVYRKVPIPKDKKTRKRLLTKMISIVLFSAMKMRKKRAMKYTRNLRQGALVPLLSLKVIR